MTYKINKTDGSLLVEVIDNEINTSAADIALIGKNVSGFGEYINENFIKLLENFAATSEPNNPIAGQIWFDTSENRLKVYDGNGFRIGSGPIVSGTAPLNPIQGDFWIDSEEKQLYFYDGTDRKLAGPIYKESQGISGFQVETISDTAGNRRAVVVLYVADKILGVFSKHEEFTPAAGSLNPSDFTGNVKTGFTPGTLAGFKFHARAASADALVDTLGNLKTANSFVSTEASGGSTSMYRTLSILNNEPLKLGAGLENTVTVTDSLFQIRSNVTPAIGDSGQEFQIVTRDSTGASSYALVIQTEDVIKRVGIFTDAPATTLDVNGSATIRGDLTVIGDTTTITATELNIADKNITLADGNALETFADGGGITLKGLTDKTFNWINSTDSWTSNQHIDLRTLSETYKIGGSTVLSYNSLGTGITTSYLTSVGTLTSLQVDNVNINGNTISSTSGDIRIIPAGISRVDFKGTRLIPTILTGIQTPSGPTDAATKGYVDAAVPADWILLPNLSVAPIFGNIYQAEVSDRFIVDTLTSGEVKITLPQNAVDGDLVRFIDAKGNFGTSSLIIRRYRSVKTDVGDFGGGVASLTEVGTYNNGGAGLATTSDGAGTGLTVSITTTDLGDTYTPDNVTIEIIDQGDGYATGEEITVAGADIGGGSDLIFVLDMHKILNANLDLEVNDPDAAFGLIFVDSTNNWKFAETTVLPVEISVDVVGTLTGDVISTNTDATVLNTSNPVAVFTGNVTGDVTGNLTGTADQADAVYAAVGSSTNSNFSLPYITATSGYLELKTDPNLLFNPSTNTLTTDYISAPLGITGPLTGNVTASTVNGTSSLTLSSGTNLIIIRSGNSGLRLSAYDNTGVQDQYAVQVTPGSNPSLRSSTLLYGDVQIANVSTSNINGSSFKLPTYTNAQLAARTLNQLNYGELIYNSDTNQIRAFIDDGSGTAGIWVTLN